MIGAKPFGCVHIVTAGEASYANLYCQFNVETINGQWGPTWEPFVYKPWHVRLSAFYAEVLTAANLPKKGIPVWLYALWRPTDAYGLANVVQGPSAKAQWAGNLGCDYGFGVMLRLPAVVAGDIITIGGAYEPLIR